MSASASDDTYRQLHFPHRREAAAFVAAISRFLHSPRGEQYLSPPGAAEIWSHAPHPHGAVDVYLNPRALAAATAAFAPVIVAGTHPAAELPAHCAQMIGAAHAPAWGLEEAERALEQLKADH
jgi:hypothetical protein